MWGEGGGGRACGLPFISVSSFSQRRVQNSCTSCTRAGGEGGGERRRGRRSGKGRIAGRRPKRGNLLAGDGPPIERLGELLGAHSAGGPAVSMPPYARVCTRVCTIVCRFVTARYGAGARGELLEDIREGPAERPRRSAPLARERHDALPELRRHVERLDERVQVAGGALVAQADELGGALGRCARSGIPRGQCRR